MAKQDKQPLPSPLNRVLDSGMIGGNGKTEIQKSVHTDTHKTVKEEKQKDSNQDNSRMKKQTILISEQLAKRVKIHATQHDTSISEITTLALEQYLAKHKD